MDFSRKVILFTFSLIFLFILSFKFTSDELGQSLYDTLAGNIESKTPEDNAVEEELFKIQVKSAEEKIQKYDKEEEAEAERESL